MIRTYQINSEVGVDINARSEFNIKVGIKVKVEWRSREKLGWSSVVSKLRLSRYQG